MEIADVSPREIEVGDRLELRGSGFPQGRPARITFRGSIHRPGERALSGTSIEVEGTVTSADRIEIAATDALEERFCGRGDVAAHATFRGDVEVAFASSAPGAPPLVGILRATTLDVRPASLRATIAEARVKEGARVLGFLGIVPGAPSPRGIPIEDVTAGSPAERAGIQAGDILGAVDGVNVGQFDDVLPASARTVELLLRHGDLGGEETKSVPMIGYAAERIPVEYNTALLLVGLALAALVLLVVPTPTVLGAIELRVASRLRATTMASFVASRIGRGPAAIAFALASVLVGTFALGPHVIAAELDGGVLLVVTIALLTVSRALVARGPMATIRACATVLGAGLVLALTVVAMVALQGALSLGELVRLQGGAPWEVAAVQKPAAALLAIAYLGTLFALLRARADAPVLALTHADDVVLTKDATRGVRRGISPRAVIERLGLLFACALGVAVFFGGWQLPGIGASRALPLQLVAAVLFVVKTWAMEGALEGAASIASPWTGAEARSFGLRRLLPTLALGVVFVVASRRFVPSASLSMAWGAMVAFAIVLLVARSVMRVRGAMLRPEPHASPFL